MRQNENVTKQSCKDKHCLPVSQTHTHTHTHTQPHSVLDKFTNLWNVHLMSTVETALQTTFYTGKGWF